MSKNQLLLVKINGLSEITGIPVRALRTLQAKRLIPFIKTGHRSIYFSPERVQASLQKLEIGGAR